MYSEEEIKKMKNEIDQLSHCEMARLWRFAPLGHTYFDGKAPWSDYFMERFKKLGDMTPEISKEIGWDK